MKRQINSSSSNSPMLDIIRKVDEAMTEMDRYGYHYQFDQSTPELDEAYDKLVEAYTILNNYWQQHE